MREVKGPLGATPYFSTNPGEYMKIRIGILVDNKMQSPPQPNGMEPYLPPVDQTGPATKWCSGQPYIKLVPVTSSLDYHGYLAPQDLYSTIGREGQRRKISFSPAGFEAGKKHCKVASII